MQASEVLFVMLLCGVPIIAAALGFIAFRQRKELKQLRQQLQEKEGQYSQAIGDHRIHARNRWLSRVHQLSFSNEVEVEVKFVYPLLLHLGYDESNFAIRYKVPMQMGREQLQKEADWVVWHRDNKNKAALVVEAKASSQTLDSYVQAQGRSYAFAMNAPMYMLTNGLLLEVYLRGIEADRCVFSCHVQQLADRWSDLDTLVGLDPTDDLPAQKQATEATIPSREVALVGESNYQDNLRRICGKPSEDGEQLPTKVRLQPEPDNPYDNLAIRAQINGQTVGYLNKVDARRFAQRVGKGIEVSGIIRGGWDHGGRDRGHYGVWVNL